MFGHGELADVVQERRRLHALDFVVRHPERPGESRGVHLDPADVALRRLILGVDGERERFDGGQMEVRDLRHVPLLILDAAHVDLVGAVGQVERRRAERRHPVAAADR